MPLCRPVNAVTDILDFAQHAPQKARTKYRLASSALTVRCKMTPREQAIWHYNLAQVYNKALEQAAELVDDLLEDDEDSTSSEGDAIRALRREYHPDHVEAWFTRRDKLLNKKHGWKATGLSDNEELELSSLSRSIATLPSCRDPRDQESMDWIHETAALLRKHYVYPASA